jgi:gamma-tubulin complex component 5
VNDWDSEPSLSPLDSDDLALDDERNSLSSAEYDESSRPLNCQPAEFDSLGRDVRIASDRLFRFEHKKQLEVLQSRQYWRDDWHTDAPLTSRFDLGDPSTLGFFVLRYDVLNLQN